MEQKKYPSFAVNEDGDILKVLFAKLGEDDELTFAVRDLQHEQCRGFIKRRSMNETHDKLVCGYCPLTAKLPRLAKTGREIADYFQAKFGTVDESPEPAITEPVVAHNRGYTEPAPSTEPVAAGD